MNKNKQRMAALVAILIVFALLCMSCAVPIPLMIPIVDGDVVAEGIMV